MNHGFSLKSSDDSTNQNNFWNEHSVKNSNFDSSYQKNYNVDPYETLFKEHTDLVAKMNHLYQIVCKDHIYQKSNVDIEKVSVILEVFFK